MNVKNAACALFIAGICFSVSATTAMASETDVAGLINQRLGWMKDVAGYKANNHLAIEDLQQEANVMNASIAEANKAGLDGESARLFIKAQMDAAKAIQYRYRADWLSVTEHGWQPQPLDKVRKRLNELNTAILNTISSNLQQGQMPDRTSFMNAVKQHNLTENDKQRLWLALSEIKRR